MTEKDWTQIIEWEPGLGDVEGMARHPSLQRRTTEQLREYLAVHEQEWENDRQIANPHSEAWGEILASDEQLVHAARRALELRGETP